MADRYVWTSADGQTIELSDWAAGYIVTDATTGLWAPTYSMTADQYAGVDGTTVQNIRAEPAEPVLAMHVSASDPVEFRAKLRGLVRAMRPKAGQGVLTVTDSTGATRSLACYCMGGMEGVQISGHASFKAALKLYAPDPWWYGDQRYLSVGLGVPTTFFPIFPLRLSPSTVQGAFTVDLSDTDAPSFPVWTITGPGTSLTLTNLTTGQTLQLAVTLTAGQAMVIDTRPGFRSILREDGTSLLQGVSGEPRLWPLVESVNDITAVLADATVDSRIEGSYQPRYAGI
jgi:hypothetical protein